MAVKSPVSILFDIDGNPVAVHNSRLLTDTTVSGVVQVGDDGGSLTVDGPLTDAELRASAVPIAATSPIPISALSLPLPLGAATEATLAALNATASGLATQATLSSFQTDFNNEDFATQSTLNSLLVAFGAEDFAQDATLSSFQDDFNATDFATDTTQSGVLVELESFRTDFNNEDFATETTLTTIANQLSGLSDDVATEATLQSVHAELDDIQVSGVQIRDQAGNVVDSTTVSGITRLEGRSSLTDTGGTLDVAVVTDNDINRLEVRSTIVGPNEGIGADVKVTTIEDSEEEGHHRLQTESRIAPGSTINIGSSIPSDPANLVIEFLTDTGGSEDMLVDGSVTPVTFTYQPPAGVSISVQDVLVVFTADDFSFDGDSFGPNTLLTIGVDFEIYADGATTELFTIRQNEDFLRIPGRIPVINNTGPKDLLSGAFAFGGLIKLHGDDGDYIRFTVNDDLTSTKLKYFTATIYGAEIED